MKPKGPNTLRNRASKGKSIKKELPSDEIINMPSVNSAYIAQSSARPSVEIVQCISYQKFRYSGENRPGKKYQEKEFMTLRLSNLQDKVVRVVIICTDADNRELIHPNGLVGKDCHDGIYDKEYAITRPIFQIKVPYLRTERMKTKKHEHKKILGVLSSRASHLPSPYRERCLSQCTDKYTTREKFDTTKVCLGVIVTVESHQGVLNGSLHAISHVVRNASEKTSLSILKLSNESVPAQTGACIDIFTTEDGPAIEPEKYEIFVTTGSDNHGIDSWTSKKYSPEKKDLLYKRVITYQVPAFEPNPNLVSPVEALLHLECPQSNQYCSHKFLYVPQGEVMIVDEQMYLRGEKRTSIERDMKLSPKRLRAEMYENDGSTETIKAKLNTKIKARNETSNSLGTVCVDSHDDSPDEDDTSHYTRERKQHKTYSHECPVIIHHQDPQTGESSFLLDMDASKSNNSSGGTATLVDGENQYLIQFQEASNILQTKKCVKTNGSIIQASPQDLKVVATGYSDTVPANTVLVYTTNGLLTDRADGSALEHVFIQGVSHEDQMVLAHSPSYTQAVLSTNKGAAAKINRGEAVSNKRLSSIVNSEDRLEGQASSDYSGPAVDNRLTTSQIPHSADTVNSMSPSTSSVVERYSPASTSFSSAIPPIRRMLLSSKLMSNSNPWEVSSMDDSHADYDIVFKSFESSNKKPLELKSEPMDEIFVSSSDSRTFSTFQNFPVIHLQEKQLIQLQRNGYIKDSQNRSDAGTTVAEAGTVSDEPAGTNSAGLSSMDVADMDMAIINLPTMKIFELAKGLEDSMTGDAEPE